MAQRTRSRASGANNDDGEGENGGATVATADAPDTDGREARPHSGEGFPNLADLKEMSSPA